MAYLQRSGVLKTGGKGYDGARTDLAAHVERLVADRVAGHAWRDAAGWHRWIYSRFCWRHDGCIPGDDQSWRWDCWRDRRHRLGDAGRAHGVAEAVQRFPHCADRALARHPVIANLIANSS